MESLVRNKSSECYELALISDPVKPKLSEKHLALTNPFYLPSQDSDLYKHREKKRLEDEQEKRRLQDYKIHEKYKFDERRSIFPEIKQKLYLLDFGPTQNSKPQGSTKKETIQEIIQRKREILLTKKSIENKRAKYSELEDDIQRIEDKIKDEKKRLTDNECKIKKFEEMRKKGYDETVQRSKELQKVKTDKTEVLKSLQDELDHLKTNIEKKNEELNRLINYKSFVDELLPNNDILDTFITTQPFLIEDYRDKLIEAMNSLETKNLFQIQQKQEDEYEHESLCRQNEATIEKKKKKLKDLSANLVVLETQLKSLQEKSNKMKGSKTFQPEPEKKTENLKASENQFSEIIPPIVRSALEQLYSVIEGEKSSISMKELEVLEILEKIEDQFIKESKFLREKITDYKKLENEVREKEKSLDKRRRAEKIDEERQKVNEEANKKKNESVKEIVKRRGRVDMQRSKLPEKVEEKKPLKENQDVVDWREFLGDDDV